MKIFKQVTVYLIWTVVFYLAGDLNHTSLLMVWNFVLVFWIIYIYISCILSSESQFGFGIEGYYFSVKWALQQLVNRGYFSNLPPLIWMLPLRGWPCQFVTKEKLYHFNKSLLPGIVGVINKISLCRDEPYIVILLCRWTKITGKYVKITSNLEWSCVL
jgi:hypothetical protein